MGNNHQWLPVSNHQCHKEIPHKSHPCYTFSSEIAFLPDWAFQIMCSLSLGNSNHPNFLAIYHLVQSPSYHHPKRLESPLSSTLMAFSTHISLLLDFSSNIDWNPLLIFIFHIWIFYPRSLFLNPWLACRHYNTFISDQYGHWISWKIETVSSVLSQSSLYFAWVHPLMWSQDMSV